MTATKEHVTALFVAGIYYWLTGQDAWAGICFGEANRIVSHASFVGDA